MPACNLDPHPDKGLPIALQLSPPIHGTVAREVQEQVGAIREESKRFDILSRAIEKKRLPTGEPY